VSWSPTSPAPELAPLRRRAYAALRQAGPPEWVPPHCLAVEALAAAMCDCAERQGLQVDRRVVQAGCILHDIGRAKAQDVRHAGTGADLLRKEGTWDERIVLCVDRHTGGGIDAEEARTLGLPVRDYTPRTLEERIVCHADNLYSGTKRLSLAELEGKYRAKGLDKAWLKIRRLHDELGALLGCDLERLAPVSLPVP